jgi:hypothetical protein
MQTALAFVPQTAPARSSESLQRAEFRFASPAALDRALALVRTQSWIASCSVDRTRLTLDVVLASGAARPVLRTVH